MPCCHALPNSPPRLSAARRGRARRAGAGLPHPADPHGDRLPGRRPDRFRRPPARRQAEGHPRPARHHREQARRQRRDRRRLRREGGARRLHAVPHHRRRGRDHAAHAHRPALRHAARLRAGHAGGAQHHRAGGARRQPGQVGQGIRRDREGEERRRCRSPRPASARPRIWRWSCSQTVGGLQVRARALSRRGARADRSARRPGRRHSSPTCRC